MRKKREMHILLIILLTVALICGCSTKEEQNNEQKVEGVEIEEDTDTYRFVDVLGNEYEAELLDIPPITQDLTRIEDQDGKKFYLGEDGEIASRLGIDVSEYQPEVDWQQVKDYGVDFVIVRLGYRGYGEAGKLVEDSMFRATWKVHWQRDWMWVCISSRRLLIKRKQKKRRSLYWSGFGITTSKVRWYMIQKRLRMTRQERMIWTAKHLPIIVLHSAMW